MDQASLMLTVSILALFYLLGKTADVVVVNVRRIGERFGIRIFFLGLILGFLTSLPDLAVSVSAVVRDIPEIALGDLLGGVLVLFGLILGGSAILNRQIATDGKAINLLPVLTYLCVPVLFGLDGRVDLSEGIVLIAGYFGIIYYLYRTTRAGDAAARLTATRRELLRYTFLTLAALIAVIVISNIIVRLTTSLLERWQVPPFMVGLLLFSLGTNLPEITITVRSWFRQIRELSLANIIGSALANILILGLLTAMEAIPVTVNAGYYALAAATAILFIFFFRSYQSNRAITRQEGMVLVAIYFLFVVSQLIF